MWKLMKTLLQDAAAGFPAVHKSEEGQGGNLGASETC